MRALKIGDRVKYSSTYIKEAKVLPEEPYDTGTVVKIDELITVRWDRGHKRGLVQKYLEQIG